MSSFTDSLITSPLEDKENWWVLRKEFHYEVGYEGSGDTIAVPAGFVTNFASIPKILWSFFPPWGEYGKASVVHDYLYYSQKRTKEESDYIFYEGMVVLGVKEGRAKFYHNMVKWFGGGGWKNSQNYMMEMSSRKIEIFDLKELSVEK